MHTQFDHIPEGFNSVNVSLTIQNVDQAITWYEQVFGAKEIFRLTTPNGVIVHAEIQIGNTIIMLSEEDINYNQSPIRLGGTGVILQIYLEKVDSVFQNALEAGAKEIFPLNDQFYGDRAGRVEDPYGHQWILAQRIKEVSIEDMQKMMEEMA